MTVHEYGRSPASHSASGLAAAVVPDLREIFAVMSGQKPVDLY